MRSSLSMSALVAAAAATCVPVEPTPEPTTSEKIAINDFTVIQSYEGEVMSVYFQLSGNNATDLECHTDELDFPSEVYTCGDPADGDSKYRFALYPGEETDYSLRLYHELGLGFGFYGQGDVFAYCHAGGLERLFCTQQYPVSIIIDAEPDVEE